MDGREHRLAVRAEGIGQQFGRMTGSRQAGDQRIVGLRRFCAGRQLQVLHALRRMLDQPQLQAGEGLRTGIEQRLHFLQAVTQHQPAGLDPERFQPQQAQAVGRRQITALFAGEQLGKGAGGDAGHERRTRAHRLGHRHAARIEQHGTQVIVGQHDRLQPGIGAGLALRVELQPVHRRVRATGERQQTGVALVQQPPFLDRPGVRGRDHLHLLRRAAHVRLQAGMQVQADRRPQREQQHEPHQDQGQRGWTSAGRKRGHRRGGGLLHTGEPYDESRRTGSYLTAG